MQSDEKILEIEEKYGCIVTDKMVKIWRKQFDLWMEFDRVCKKHNLTYFFFWGALLGAVRHNGFIPWDDDIDVVMPRADYDILLNMDQNEFKKPYFLLNKKSSEGSIFWFIKLVDENTTCIWNNLLNPVKHHQGLSLDIVPLDGVPDSKGKRKKHFNKHKIDFSLMNKVVTDSAMLSLKGKLIKVLGKLYCLGKSREECIEKTERIRAEYSWDASDEISEAAHFIRFKKADFESVVYISFEGCEAPVPCGYERILKQLYGDYLKLPDPLQRKVPEDVAAGWVIEPDIPFWDYYQITQKRKESLIRMKKKSHDGYCN